VCLRGIIIDVLFCIYTRVIYYRHWADIVEILVKTKSNRVAQKHIKLWQKSIQAGPRITRRPVTRWLPTAPHFTTRPRFGRTRIEIIDYGVWVSFPLVTIEHTRRGRSMWVQNFMKKKSKKKPRPAGRTHDHNIILLLSIPAEWSSNETKAIKIYRESAPRWYNIYLQASVR